MVPRRGAGGRAGGQRAGAARDAPQVRNGTVEFFGITVQFKIDTCVGCGCVANGLPARLTISLGSLQTTPVVACRRLGLLAAALGDGSLRVWAVPQPRALPGEGRHHAAAANGGSLANGSSRGTGGGSSSEALIVNLDPVLVITAEQLGGSMPATIDWLPAKPHDLLLVSQ